MKPEADIVDAVFRFVEIWAASSDPNYMCVLLAASKHDPERYRAAFRRGLEKGGSRGSPDAGPDAMERYLSRGKP